jgi:hypothetical protein
MRPAAMRTKIVEKAARRLGRKEKPVRKRIVLEEKKAVS